MPRPTQARYDFRREVEAYLSPGTYDSLRQPLYDRVTVAAAAIAANSVRQFFQTPVGQAGKTELDTNMRLAGQLPANHVYEVWSPRLIVHPALPSAIGAPTALTVLSDVDSWIHSSFVRFRIVTQEKLLAPSWYLPAAAGLAGFTSGATTVAATQSFPLYASHGLPSMDAAQRLDPFPVIIPPLQTFSFELTVGAVGFTQQNAVDLWIVLDGILHRTALP